MRMQEEQIRNVSKIFEAFTRAIAKGENIKIEYLDCDGEIHDIYIDINKSNSIKFLKFSFDLGYIDISYDEDLRFNSNITDIQSVTTFRTTKLKFREVNKK
jgi:hypothetical protein